MDDFWSLQLDKLDSFQCLRPLNISEIEEGAESSDDEDDDDEDDGGGDEEGDEEGEPDNELGDGEEVELGTADVEMAPAAPVLSKVRRTSPP